MKQFIFTFLICLGFISFSLAQEKTDTRKWNQDPRMVNIGPVSETPTIFEIPLSHLNYVHPNKIRMVFETTSGTITVDPNFRVHPSNVTQSETPIVTHPTNKNIMYGSSNAVTISPLFISEGVYVTTNGGTNWFGSDTTNASPITDHGGEPAPSIDMNGRFYQSYISYSLNGLWVTNSANKGNTWAAATKIITGNQDKNHTFTVNNASSPYNGRTFVIWTRFTATNPPISVSYTTNNGTSWSTYTDINVPDVNHFSQGCNGAVAPNGDIYVCWQNPISAIPYTGDYIGFAKSTNGGTSWTYNNNIYDCNGLRGYIKTAQIRVFDFPWMAVDKSGGTRNGWIYIVTPEKNLSPAGSDPDIVLHRSTDGGTTWSSGIRVNQDALNNGKDQYMPCVIVESTGTVDVVYYDNRNTTSDSTQVYISRSIDGGTTWSDIQVSDHSFKPVPISGLATGYQGDYIGITEGPSGTIWPFWADNVSGIYQAWTTKVTVPSNPYILSLTALIQGCYNGSKMIPSTVRVELHDVTTKAGIESSIGTLDSTGFGTFSFSTAANGTPYYIVLKYKNGIETWSAVTLSFASNVLNYNFTTTAGQAYGSNQILKGSKYCIYNGDINQDGIVDLSDMILVDNDNTNIVKGNVDTDVNGDGLVDLSDMIIVDNNNTAFISKVVPSGAPTDTIVYEGQTYHTVLIGTKYWLKENLNVGKRINGSLNQTNNEIIEKYCYNDAFANCTKYGGLYQWDEAMQYASSGSDVQGICPSGWHLPDTTEFSALASAVNNDGNSLKAIGQGTGSGAGTNTSGFTALLAGERNTGGTFDLGGLYGLFWASIDYLTNYGYFMQLYNSSSSIFESGGNFKTRGYSIRCVKN